VKEITIKIVVRDKDILSIIRKSGFNDTIDSDFEVIGILSKLVRDAQAKYDKKMEQGNHLNIKRPKKQVD